MTNKKNENIEPFERDNILKLLSESITELKKKAFIGRIKDEKKAKVKTDQFRALIYSCNVYNTVLKDKQIDTMQKDIEIIKMAVISNEVENKEELKEDLEVVEEALAKIEEG